MSTEHSFVKFQGVSSFDGGWRGRKFRPMSSFVAAAKSSYEGAAAARAANFLNELQL